MTIGRLARNAGVGVETIRFYEREELITTPPRPKTGHRQYSTDTVARIRFIRRAQQLGFTLKEIKELISLHDDSDARSAAVRERAVAKLADVDRKMADLARVSSALHELVCCCRGEGPITDCAIIESLSHDEN